MKFHQKFKIKQRTLIVSLILLLLRKGFLSVIKVLFILYLLREALLLSDGVLKQFSPIS